MQIKKLHFILLIPFLLNGCVQGPAFLTLIKSERAFQDLNNIRFGSAKTHLLGIDIRALPFEEKSQIWVLTAEFYNDTTVTILADLKKLFIGTRKKKIESSYFFSQKTNDDEKIETSVHASAVHVSPNKKLYVSFGENRFSLNDTILVYGVNWLKVGDELFSTDTLAFIYQ
jgi:hypothetical protein